MAKLHVLALALTGLAVAVPATRPAELFRRDCPELLETAEEFGCEIYDFGGCEICCDEATDASAECHPGHDENPCGGGRKQWHCEAHSHRRRRS